MRDVSGELNFNELVLPDRGPAHTELLDLPPVPRQALYPPENPELGRKEFFDLYEGKFEFFNKVQTQAFNTLFHSESNVLLGAPTGSGKTDQRGARDDGGVQGPPRR